MLTLAIEVYQEPYVPRQHKHQGIGRWKGKEGTDDHKRFIFQRAYSNCHWEEGDMALWKRNPVQILNILKDPDQQGVEWKGLSPQFVEVWLPTAPTLDEEFFMVHPSDLKKPKG
jgi:hypothetical protein